MTTRRIHLKDYSEVELREMPAGPLCHWLLAQALGGEPSAHEHPVGSYRVSGGYPYDWTRGKFDVHLGWWNDKDEPTDYPSSGKWSTDWSAAGPLLERLMRESGMSPARMTTLLQEMDDDKLALEPFKPVNIARAALVLAQRAAILDRQHAKGLAKYGTGLADCGLTRQQLLDHAAEEAADLLCYLIAAKEAPDGTV